MVKIKASSKRNPVPQSFELKGDINVTTWGAISVNKADFFPSSFQIKSNDRVIYIDPVEVESDLKADYIFITHAHPDHLSVKDLEKLSKNETVIICPAGVARKLNKYDYKIQKVAPGQSFTLENNLKYETVEAYNTRNVFLWIKAHRKSQKNVGYVLSFNGKRIYHAGDTDSIPGIKNLQNIDLALIPIGGDNLTMNLEEAANMVNNIKPLLVVPMHYELSQKHEVSGFPDLVGKHTIVKIMD